MFRQVLLCLSEAVNDMEMLKEISFCLMISAAAGTLVTVLVPRGAMDKTVRAVVGIFVVAAICSPFYGIGNGNSVSEAFADFGSYDFDESYAKDMNDALINSFVTALENRLGNFAAERGIRILSLDTDLYVDDEYCINIHKITVTVENCRLYDIEELSREISEELGIPVDVTEE